MIVLKYRGILSLDCVPVFTILEVRPKIKKKSILFLPLPLQYLLYVKRSIGWQTFFLYTFCMKKVKQESFLKIPENRP